LPGDANEPLKRDGLFGGYGGINRPGWEETVDLYLLYHALEYWDWAALIGTQPPSWLPDEMERVAGSTS
jgi:hypothetical protein